MNYIYDSHRKIIARAVVLVYLFSLTIRLWAYDFPIQLQSPTLKSFNYELAYWFASILNIDTLLSQNIWIGNLFVLGLFALCLLIFLMPKRPIFFILFGSLFFLYFVVSNIYLTFSHHYLALLLLPPFAFWAKSDRLFSLLWQGLRFYFCWLFASAFIFKITNGALFQWEYGSLIFKEQNAGYLFLNPDTFFSKHIYGFFLAHTDLLNIGQKLVFLCEGFFIVGFFTRKYDKVLWSFAFFIFAANSIFADTIFTEQFLMCTLFFIKPERWKRLEIALPKLL